MPRKAKELGPLQVSKLTAPGLHFIGGVSGLALQVLPSGGRTWVLLLPQPWPQADAETWGWADFRTFPLPTRGRPHGMPAN